jgi:hypothetical protein
MRVDIYKRHSADCSHKADRNCRRCECPVWLQTNENGKQRLWSAKTRVWVEGERKAKEIERAYDATGITPTAAKTPFTATNTSQGSCSISATARTFSSSAISRLHIWDRGRLSGD